MSLKISEKSRLMPASAIRKLVPLADAAKAEGTKVYHLNVGAPDIKSPDCAFEAVEDACRKLHHLSYTNSAGLMELRKGLVEKYYRRIGIDIEVSELLVEVAGSEAFANGAEIVRLARMVQSFDAEKSTAEEKQVFLEDRIKAFFKDYEPTLDQKVLAAMLKIVRERVDEDRLPDIYTKIDKKYKGDYEKYAAYLFKKTSLLSEEKIAKIINDPKEYAKISKDPAVELSLSAMMALYSLEQEMSDAEFDIYRGERLYFAGLKEMNPDKALPSDANFTMRMSYGSIGGYRPYDAAWYNYYSTDRGVLEKEDPTSDEFYVQPEILDLFKKRDFGPYANEKGELQLCFLSNNDITGGNSGSPIFDKNARLIGLAFDGNWEAMSGDIAFEPELQRCIGVDIRYVLFMIDKWGKCPRLIDELKLVR